VGIDVAERRGYNSIKREKGGTHVFERWEAEKPKLNGVNGEKTKNRPAKHLMDFRLHKRREKNSSGGTERGKWLLSVKVHSAEEKKGESRKAARARFIRTIHKTR